MRGREGGSRRANLLNHVKDVEEWKESTAKLPGTCPPPSPLDAPPRPLRTVLFLVPSSKNWPQSPLPPSGPLPRFYCAEITSLQYAT